MQAFEVNSQLELVGHPVCAQFHMVFCDKVEIVSSVSRIHQWYFKWSVFQNMRYESP